MPAWQWLLDAAVVVLLLLLCYGLILVARRRVISRHGGTFELSVRVRTEHAGRGWVLGLGRYHFGRLEWYRIFSPSPRPRRYWERADLEILDQRDPEGAEAFAVYSGHLIVTCETPTGPVELAMSPSALTGFSSWLEAAPPGTDWDQRRQRH